MTCRAEALRVTQAVAHSRAPWDTLRQLRASPPAPWLARSCTDTLPDYKSLASRGLVNESTAWFS